MMQIPWPMNAPRPIFGAGCACHSPAIARINRRFAADEADHPSIWDAARAAARGHARHMDESEEQRPILFVNTPIFDGRSDHLRHGLNVLISGNTIEALLPEGQDVAGARIIDCEGRVLMPGLIDAHWHAILAGISLEDAMTADVPYLHLVAAREAERTLLRGFTTIRDMGGPTFALKRAIDEELIRGPRIFPSGAMISQTSGHGDFRARREVPSSPQAPLSAAESAGIAVIADGRAEVLRRTREQLLLGASQVKIMVGGGVSSIYDPIDTMQFTADEIRAAVEAATDWGTYVAAHVYVPAGITRALMNGVLSIEHGQLADEEAFQLMIDAGAWWSLQPFLNDEDANPKPTEAQQRDQIAIAEGTVRAYEMARQHLARVAWGTDILFNPNRTWTQNRQLTKLSRWLAPYEVLQMATSRNAELCGLSGPRNPYPGALGVIEPGALADILVVDGNPLEELDLIADPEANLSLIMKDGIIHKSSLAS